ncbi:MAG TPA: PAS domain-containing protein, partial [Ideonella sp.]|nr:PAS domain-containing protein [Ideonella sp.]
EALAAGTPPSGDLSLADGTPLALQRLGDGGWACVAGAPAGAADGVLTPAGLESMLERGRIGVYRHDLASDIVHCSRSACAVMNVRWRPEGVPLAEIRARIHPDDLPNVVASAHDAALRDGPTDIEARNRGADGRWRYIVTRRIAERDAHGRTQAFVGLMLDLSEPLESARKALELTRRLELTGSAAGVGVWVFRPDTREAEWNEQMWALSGLAREGAPPDPAQWIERVVHPDDRNRVLDEARRWLREGRPVFETELRVSHADGQVRWLVIRARLERAADGLRMFGVMLDVTERRAAEAALRSADQRAALAARGAGIGTWEREVASGRAIWDEQMFRLRGLEPCSEAPGLDERLACVHPDDVSVVRRVVAALIEHGEPADYEYRVRRPDGRERWLAARAVALRGDGGEVERLIGVNWDVTEAKDAERSRREREAAQRESRAKSQFMARMSHELRTPLNAVLGFTQLLQSDDDASAMQRRERLDRIRAAGAHLLELIDEVLDLSSLESGQLRLDIAAVPLDGVAREALAMVEPFAAERGVALDAGTLAGHALVDRTRLRQVLINLLSNANKYNRPGGRVRIEASRLDSHLAIRVADSGRGMTREQLAHLFEPFNRLGAEREGISGTGIGLVIARVLVERMGGSIAVQSEPGQGSVFELRLPLPGEAPPPARPPAGSASSSAAPRGRLLYIEDNPVNTLLVAELVAQRPGLALECAADGASGLARAAGGRPDLILIDMQLPDMDGHEVLRRLRAQAGTAATPCIALSANALPQDIEHALAEGFADYWTKPIDLGAVLSALDALFGA